MGRPEGGCLEGIWIGLAFALGLAAWGLGLPPLIGYLAAGFVLNAFGFVGGELLEHVAHLGVLLLLFSVGLKVRLRNVLRPEVWGSALIHIVIVSSLGALAFRMVFGIGWAGSVLLAMALSFSSTVVAAKALEDKRELRSFHGRVAIGVLIVQDLVAVVLLAFAGAGSPSPAIVLLLALPLARPFLHRLLDVCGHGELMLLYGVLLSVAIGGFGFELLGLSPELGALVLGALLAGHTRAHELSKALWGLREIFLVGFFLSIGMAGLPDLGAVMVALLLVLVLLPLKVLLFLVVLPRFGLRVRSGFLAALALASYSEFGLIAVDKAAAAGWLQSSELSTMALTVALSFAVAARLNRAAHTLYERWQTRLQVFESERRHPDDEPLSLGAAQIVVMGMGRVGTGAYDYLRDEGARVIGLDSDPGKIEQQLARGRRVLYADAEDPGFWHRLSLANVEAVLLALPDLEAKEIAAKHLRARGFTGLVSATNVFPEEAERIVRAGADTTFNYFNLAGGKFAEHTWAALDEGGRQRARGEDEAER